MLTPRLRTAPIATLAVATAVLAAVPAYADSPGVGSSAECGAFVCGVEVDVPGSGGGSSGGTGGGGGKGPKRKPPECTQAKKVEPQPASDSGIWEGQDPAKGAVLYMRTCRYFMADGSSTMITETLVGGPGGPAAPAVDPAVLAQQAADQMTLRGPDIGIVPKPGGMGLVGMPVYMWTERGPETYGPNTASASAGGITVTATAKVQRIVWQMGDGKTVTCTTPGTPYKPAYGKRPSPDCGHRYAQPSLVGAFHVVATSTWTVDWQATTGQSGQMTQTRRSAVDIRVGELQAVGSS
ncbi:ATP/GTP-binding protein [Streptomyces sp. NPDC056144]|uniref:ATP/GTP-binding protein n=1 Tax=unclassified Streptomyces TaxID=2593676 RepID=UPI0035DE9F76